MGDPDPGVGARQRGEGIGSACPEDTSQLSTPTPVPQPAEAPPVMNEASINVAPDTGRDTEAASCDGLRPIPDG
jgi:hypothetical protein